MGEGTGEPSSGEGTERGLWSGRFEWGRVERGGGGGMFGGRHTRHAIVGLWHLLFS